MTENKLNFVGRVEKKEFSNGGSIFKVSFGPKDIEAMQSYANSHKGWVNIDLCFSKDGKPFMKFNDFVSGGAKKQAPVEIQEDAQQVLNKTNEEDDELPF